MENRFETFSGSIVQLNRCLQKIKDLEMRRLGLRANHAMCLYYLGRHPEGLTATQLTDLCREDKAAISRRAKKEAWAQDVTGAVDRAVDAKVNGIVNTVDPEKKAAAIASAADEKVAVIIRHREEWETQRALVTTAIEKNDFDKAKLAKITAETLKIRQEAERKAWGIRDVDAQPDGGALTVRILRVSGE